MSRTLHEITGERAIRASRICPACKHAVHLHSAWVKINEIDGPGRGYSESSVYVCQSCAAVLRLDARANLVLADEDAERDRLGMHWCGVFIRRLDARRLRRDILKSNPTDPAFWGQVGDTGNPCRIP